MVGAWLSPGTPASSTTKTGRHDIAEILLKVPLNTKNQIKSNQILIVANTNVDSLVVFVFLNRFKTYWVFFVVKCIEIAFNLKNVECIALPN
jgi:hypothetical protein